MPVPTADARAEPDERDLPCQELVELVSDYLDGVLPDALVARVEAHLAECDGCRRYLEQMRLTVGALRRPPADGRDALPPSVRDELLRRFRDWAAGRRD